MHHSLSSDHRHIIVCSPTTDTLVCPSDALVCLTNTDQKHIKLKKRVLYWECTETRRLRILKLLSKLQLTKEIRDNHVRLQNIKAHWEEYWPILSVSSSNNSRGNKDYPGPEVRKLNPPGRNVFELRQKWHPREPTGN